MKIIAGDETGLLKVVDTEKKEVIRKYGTQGKDSSVISIQQFELMEQHQFIVVLQQSSITILDDDLNEIIVHPIQAMQPINLFRTNDEDNHSFYVVGKDSRILKLTYSIEDNQLNEEMIQPSPMKYTLNSARFLRDGLILQLYTGQPPRIYDLINNCIHWSARNVKNDELDLQVKMEDFDGALLDDYSVAVLTVHKTVRVYDITKQKSQPIDEFQIKDSRYPIHQIKLHHNKIYIGNQKGEVLVYARGFTLIGKLKGTQGSIRDMICTTEYIVTGSLDRYLRIYGTEDNKLLQSYNLGQRLTSLALIELKGQVDLVEKEEIKWTLQTGEQARARFAGMRKHTIKLNYLAQMFENQKKLKIKQQQKLLKQQEQQAQQEQVNEEYVPLVRKRIAKITKKDKIPKVFPKHLTNKPLGTK